jgi:serine/threonine protein kinase
VQPIHITNETDLYLKKKLDSLSGCIHRLDRFASQKLLAAYAEGERLLAETEELQDSRQSRIEAACRWHDSPEIEFEIIACAQLLAENIPLSLPAIESLAIRTDLVQEIESDIERLVCAAVRNGHARMRDVSLATRRLVKLSCHFEKDAIPKIDVRQLICGTSTKKIFKLVHLTQGCADWIEAYAKIPKELQRQDPLKYHLHHTRLRESADLAHQFHTLIPPAPQSHEPGEKFLLNGRVEFHRKDPLSFKGMVMEFCDGGDLSELSPPTIPEERRPRLELSYQTALAIQSMHERHLCHLDIKPENIFLKNEEGGLSVRLGDYDFTDEEGKKGRGLAGTRIFRPPEVLTADMWTVSPSIDMWSFGLTLLELFHGVTANLFFTGMQASIFDTSKQLIMQTWEARHKGILSHLDSSDPVDQLIIELLNFHDPSKRPSAQETAARLRALLN